MIQNFEQLINKVQNGDKKKKVVVIAAHDRHTLDAVFEAKSNNIIDPILIGNAEKINEILNTLSESLPEASIINTASDKESAEIGVAMIRESKADFMMKGNIQTADLLAAVVDKDKGLRTDKIMSHFVLMELPTYNKLIVTTDGGMVMYPNLEQKKMIVENAVMVMHSFGYKSPKVAILTAVETVNLKMQETLDADALKKMNQKGELCGCIVEGPISYDLAMSKQSAEAKGYESEVAGDADILLVPNITAGNILGKALLFSAGARMAGFVVGAKVPIVLTSRGATVEEKYLSIVISAAYV
jgi:phosphate butyryltransferase